MADSLHSAKRMLGHSYMSSMVDMTQICSDFASVPVDAFVIRAASKAYKATIDSEGPLNVSRVFSHGKRVSYVGVEDLRVNQIVSAGQENAPTPEGQPLLQVYQLEDSIESLPISEDPILMSIHFSPPSQQVSFEGGSGVIDIACESFGDEEGAGEVLTIGADQIRIIHKSRVSISYDVAKVDDQTAAEFLSKVKSLLDDPELLLL